MQTIIDVDNLCAEERINGINTTTRTQEHLGPKLKMACSRIPWPRGRWMISSTRVTTAYRPACCSFLVWIVTTCGIQVRCSNQHHPHLHHTKDAQAVDRWPRLLRARLQEVAGLPGSQLWYRSSIRFFAATNVDTKPTWICMPCMMIFTFLLPFLWMLHIHIDKYICTLSYIYIYI